MRHFVLLAVLILLASISLSLLFGLVLFVFYGLTVLLVGTMKLVWTFVFGRRGKHRTEGGAIVDLEEPPWGR